MSARSFLSVLTLLGAVLFSPASNAQVLDNAWFKVTANVKGGARDDAGDLSSIKGKVVAYMFVQLTPPVEGVITGVNYHASIWSEVKPDVWVLVSETDFLALGPDESGMVGPTAGLDDAGVELGMALEGSGGEGGVEFIRMHFTARLKIKLDKEGALKKASFKSFGAVMPEGFSEGEDLFGGGKVSGKTVDPSKLPFAVKPV